MSLDTTKSVKSITYNGTNIPLYSKPEQTKTVDLSMASGNQVISPDSGKVLSKITVNKPSTLVAENIKKDVNIGGVVGTLESGGGDVPLVTVTFKATNFGAEVNSPGEDEIVEMSRMVISAFVNGNLSLSSVRSFSQQWGGMAFPFNVAVPQSSSVTICNNSSMGGSVAATNALVAYTSADGINSVSTVYNITDGATITIEVA